MPVKNHAYLRPPDWETAQAALARSDLAAVALFHSPRPNDIAEWPGDLLVDLSCLELDRIWEADEAVHIGSLCSLQALVESALLQEGFGDVLARAASSGCASSLRLRNYTDLGGALREPGVTRELTLALLVLGAQVEVHGLDGVLRRVDLPKLVAGQAEPARGEVISAVRIPLSPAGTAALERVARTPCDTAIVAAAAWVAGRVGTCETARVAVSGAAGPPQRIPAVEAYLAGRTLEADSIHQAAVLAETWAAGLARPLGDYLGSPDYRRAMAGLLVQRALSAAAQAASRDGRL